MFKWTTDSDLRTWIGASAETKEATVLKNQIIAEIEKSGENAGYFFKKEMFRQARLGNVNALQDVLENIEKASHTKSVGKLMESFEKGNWTWMEGAGSLTKKAGSALHTVTVKPAAKAWGGLKSVGKIAGFGAAALVGAGLISSYLSGKREQSAEAMANEPSQAPMDFNPSFGPAYAGPTGNVPPVEGDWVAKTRGGEMNRAAMPPVPDVASRAQAIEQSRSDAGVTPSTLAV